MDKQMTPEIRRATSGDTSSLLRLVEEYWRFEGITGFDGARVERLLQRLLADARLGAAWIASVDDAPVAYLLAVYVFSLEHLGLTAEIDEFFVVPRARDSGIGAGMIEAAEAGFIAAGCTNVSLQVGQGNDAGRAFYLRHGYALRSGFGILDKVLTPGL